MRHIVIFIITILWSSCYLPSKAQTNQVVANGASTQAVTFGGSGCFYNWICSNPAIGLAASGTGNIAAFTAINKGTTPITATIIATPTVGGMAYIANDYISTVSVIDLSNNTVLTTIPVGVWPTSASVSPNTNRVYVANSDESSISVINSLTNTAIAKIGVGAYPFAVYASPDGSRVYAANYDDNNISVIDAATNTVVNKWSSGVGPLFMTSINNGGVLYVNNYDINSTAPGTVTVINTATGAKVTTIAVGVQPWGITKSADDKFVFVASAISSSVSVINTATNTIVSTIPTNRPRNIDVSPDGTLLYARNSSTNNLDVINVQSHAVLTSLPMGGTGSAGITVSPDGKRIVALNQINSVATIIDATTNTVIANVTIPGDESLGMGNCILGGGNCSPVTFTITVNPTPNVTAGSTSGNIIACVGTASANPNIIQFPVVATNLSNDINVAAPANFEVSLTPASGYAQNITLTQTGGAVNDVVYVRSAANVPGGTINGNITLISTGATTQTVSVAGVVNPMPIVNPIFDESYKNGDVTNTINFTGSADTYTWVNNNISIGLAATGTGNIVGFKAINTGIKTAIANITVTPVNLTGCDGNPVNFNIIVNPPVVIPETITIPNAFTPNGDGINDTWAIGKLNTYANALLKVFNRYGQMVFSSRGYPQPWDGRSNNRNVPDGVYYYVIDLKDGSEPATGHVTVMR